MQPVLMSQSVRSRDNCKVTEMKSALNIIKHEFRFGIADIWSDEAFSQLVKRHYGISELEHLGVTELMELEKLTHSAISQIRTAKVIHLIQWKTSIH
ncbi:hypothetical protein RJT34_03734 [Clitoria ternatea]|uniref:Uncharacterized protein n=1 Tax=Clitoria ternatea TaxID=43366 RepID=A0AAN9Q013_CLITE